MRDVEKLIVKLSFFIKFKVKEENKRKEKKKKKVFDNESSENDGKCILSQIDYFVMFQQNFIYQYIYVKYCIGYDYIYIFMFIQCVFYFVLVDFDREKFSVLGILILVGSDYIEEKLEKSQVF